MDDVSLRHPVRAFLASEARRRRAQAAQRREAGDPRQLAADAYAARLREERRIGGDQEVPTGQVAGFWMVVDAVRAGEDETVVLTTSPGGGGGEVLPGVVLALTLVAADIDTDDEEEPSGTGPFEMWRPATWPGVRVGVVLRELWNQVPEFVKDHEGARVVPVTVVDFDLTRREVTVSGVAADDVHLGSSLSLQRPDLPFPGRWPVARTDR